jgi:hypothetical protein
MGPMLGVGKLTCQAEGMLDVEPPPEPQHDDDLRAAVAQWRTWLAGRVSAWSDRRRIEVRVARILDRRPLRDTESRSRRPC